VLAQKAVEVEGIGEQRWFSSAAVPLPAVGRQELVRKRSTNNGIRPGRTCGQHSAPASQWPQPETESLSHVNLASRRDSGYSDLTPNGPRPARAVGLTPHGRRLSQNGAAVRPFRLRGRVDNDSVENLRNAGLANGRAGGTCFILYRQTGAETSSVPLTGGKRCCRSSELDHRTAIDIGLGFDRSTTFAPRAGCRTNVGSRP